MPEILAEKEERNDKFMYFVDGTKYDTDQENVTGSLIKAKIPNFDPSYQLFLESVSGAPDELISDDTKVSLHKEHGPRRFYTVPPATFGRL